MYRKPSFNSVNLTLSEDPYTSSPSSSLSSVDQTSLYLPNQPYPNYVPYTSPRSDRTYNSPSSSPIMAYPNMAYQLPQDDHTIPFNYRQPSFVPFPESSRQQNTNQACCAPSLLFGGSDPSAGQGAEVSQPETAHASPLSSIKSDLPHSPSLDSFSPQLYSPMSPIMVRPEKSGPVAPILIPAPPKISPLHKPKQYQAYGITGKVPLSDEENVVDVEDEAGVPVEGRKRSRIAQACEKCRVRKARCFGGDPCNRCVKRRFSCQFSATIRQRGPTKPHDGTERKPRAGRPSITTGKGALTKRKIAVISPNAEIEDDEHDYGEEDEDVSPNQLGLELLPASDDIDADAEGEDEEDAAQAWYTLPKSLSSLNNQSTYPFTFAAPMGTYGFNPPNTPTMPQPSSSVNPQNSTTLLNYANAAAYIRREAQQQLAFAYGGGGPTIGPGDDGGLQTSGHSETSPSHAFRPSEGWDADVKPNMNTGGLHDTQAIGDGGWATGHIQSQYGSAERMREVRNVGGSVWQWPAAETYHSNNRDGNDLT